MFADDTKIHYPLINDEAATKLQEDLDALQDWADDMQMTFSPSNCHVMHIGKNNPENNYKMRTNVNSMHCKPVCNKYYK